MAFLFSLQSFPFPRCWGLVALLLVGICCGERKVLPSAPPPEGLSEEAQRVKKSKERVRKWQKEVKNDQKEVSAEMLKAALRGEAYPLRKLADGSSCPRLPAGANYFIPPDPDTAPPPPYYPPTYSPRPEDYIQILFGRALDNRTFRETLTGFNPCHEQIYVLLGVPLGGEEWEYEMLVLRWVLQECKRLFPNLKDLGKEKCAVDPAAVWQHEDGEIDNPTAPPLKFGPVCKTPYELLVDYVEVKEVVKKALTQEEYALLKQLPA